MSKFTPGPWVIRWYECKMDEKDVAYAKENGNALAKVGDVLWRAPHAIGPCEIEHSHWGGNLLTVEDSDAFLMAAAPSMYNALEALARVAKSRGIPSDAADATLKAARGEYDN